VTLICHFLVAARAQDDGRNTVLNTAGGVGIIHMPPVMRAETCLQPDQRSLSLKVSFIPEYIEEHAAV